MPQARSSGSKSSSGSAKRSSASKSAGAKRTTARKTSSASGAGRTGASRATGAAPSAANGAGAIDPRLDAVAQRIRKLNERIIEEGKSAGEATLSSYEKALKAIASSIERGPGKSEIEWISSLATTQAKFIRDVTEAWTSAARGMLK